jgi:hypothetical protein
MARLITSLRTIGSDLIWWILLICNLALLRATAREVEIEYPVAPFRIMDSGGETGFRVDYLSEHQSGSNGKANFSNRSFQEFTEYWMRGYVYHPRFLEVRARIELGLLQQLVKRQGVGEDDGEFSNNTYLDSYDINLNFFKDHPYSLMLFANRERTPVLQLFTDLEMIESERYGAVFNIKKGPFPMDFSFSEARSRELGLDSISESKTRTFEYVLRNQLQQRIFSEFRYRHMEYDQDFDANSSSFDIERHTRLKSDDLSFMNTIYLNPDHTSSLASTLRLFRQSGTQEFENMYWQERLGLRHTANFSTYYMASLLNNKLVNNTVRTTRAEAGLDYRLFRSLDTHFDLHTRRVDYGSSSEDVYGGTGRLGYRKQTPWGMLTSGYGRTLDQVKRSGTSNRQPIIDETVIMRDGTTVYLNHPAPITDTINITDITGTIIYDEDFDYEILKVGNRVGLRPLIGGRIKDEDPVLVDYEIEVTQDISYLSDLQSFNLGYDFERYIKGLSLYYRWQDLQADGADSVDDYSVLTFNDKTYGMTYHWLWLNWIEEYQQYRSNYSSYDQLRSELEGYHQLGERLKLGWHAGLTNVDYLDGTEPDHSQYIFAGVSLHGRIRDRGYWEVESRLRRETGLTDETSIGVSGKLGCRWRKVKLEMGGRMEQRDRSSTSRNQMLMFLQVTREFKKSYIPSE